MTDWTEERVAEQLAACEDARLETLCPVCGAIDECAVIACFAGEEPPSAVYASALREIQVLRRALELLCKGDKSMAEQVRDCIEHARKEGEDE